MDIMLELFKYVGLELRQVCWKYHKSDKVQHDIYPRYSIVKIVHETDPDTSVLHDICCYLEATCGLTSHWQESPKASQDMEGFQKLNRLPASEA